MIISDIIAKRSDLIMSSYYENANFSLDFHNTGRLKIAPNKQENN